MMKEWNGIMDGCGSCLSSLTTFISFHLSAARGPGACVAYHPRHVAAPRVLARGAHGAATDGASAGARGGPRDVCERRAC